MGSLYHFQFMQNLLIFNIIGKVGCAFFLQWFHVFYFIFKITFLNFVPLHSPPYHTSISILDFIRTCTCWYLNFLLLHFIYFLVNNLIWILFNVFYFVFYGLNFLFQWFFFFLHDSIIIINFLVKFKKFSLGFWVLMRITKKLLNAIEYRMRGISFNFLLLRNILNVGLKFIITLMIVCGSLCNFAFKFLDFTLEFEFSRFFIGKMFVQVS